MSSLALSNVECGGVSLLWSAQTYLALPTHRTQAMIILSQLFS
jgi:hypothetical protein